MNVVQMGRGKQKLTCTKSNFTEEQWIGEKERREDDVSGDVDNMSTRPSFPTVPHLTSLMMNLTFGQSITARRGNIACKRFHYLALRIVQCPRRL